MSRDIHRGLQCPHCSTHLALVPITPDNADTASPDDTATAPPVPPPAATRRPLPAVNPATVNPAASPAPTMILREEWTPPPVAEVLAVYAGRSKDSATAMRGAARVRDSLNRARVAATQRRTAQKTARSSTQRSA